MPLVIASRHAFTFFDSLASILSNIAALCSASASASESNSWRPMEVPSDKTSPASRAMIPRALRNAPVSEFPALDNSVTFKGGEHVAMNCLVAGCNEPLHRVAASTRNTGASEPRSATTVVEIAANTPTHMIIRSNPARFEGVS